MAFRFAGRFTGTRLVFTLTGVIGMLIWFAVLAGRF